VFGRRGVRQDGRQRSGAEEAGGAEGAWPAPVAPGPRPAAPAAPASLLSLRGGAPTPAPAASDGLARTDRPAGAAPAPSPAETPEAAGGPDVATERDWIQRARQGDPGAFEQLIAPLMQPAYQLAVRLLGDRHLAEDVAQDALTKAYLALHHFRGDARFSTWVFRIVHNACTDALRYRARRPQTPLPFGLAPREGESGPREPADAAPGPEDVVLARLGRQDILEAMAALPADHRSVVLLRDVQGLSYEEVAAITACNVGTVKSRLHRARAALRAALAGPAAGGGPGMEPKAAGVVSRGASRETDQPGAPRARGVD